MNLNDVLTLLPVSIRGRFSSQDNAWWIRQAAACIQRIERIPVGPNRIRKAMGYQMSSGFVPKPKCLATINNAWLDDEPVAGLVEKDDRGFQLSKGAVTFDKRNVEVSTSDEFTAEVTFTDIPYPGSIESFRTVTIKSFDGPDNVNTDGVMEITDGLPVPQYASSFVNYPLWINGEELHIKSANYTVGGISFKVWETSEQVIASDLVGQQLGYPSTDALADYEAQVGGEQVVLATSSWIQVVSTPGGFSEGQGFSCERAHPGRVWTGTQAGILVKSNLIVEGYRTLARPTSMTDELDLPEGSEDLVASYLRWRGESDMDPDSATALKCEKDFEANLQKFSVDQSQTNGESMPHAYNMNISLTRGRF